VLSDVNAVESMCVKLAAMAERWNLEHEANFYFLIFSVSWGRIEKY